VNSRSVPLPLLPASSQRLAPEQRVQERLAPGPLQRVLPLLPVRPVLGPGRP
jgi:hypothetical protein